MKKFICMLAALVLCLSVSVAAVAAGAVPSKTTGDMTKFEVSGENLPEDSNFFIRPVGANEEAYQKTVEACQNELGKLAGSENVSAYFGEVKDAAGKTVSLAEVVGSDSVNVHEFCAFIAGEYQESYGNVTATMLFSTPYQPGEKVVVMIGIVSVNADGTQMVKWVAYEGVGVDAAGVENQGCIKVELDPAIVEAIQSGNALLAVVSK